jgi:predicted dinucleotide-binding enzyme
MSGNDENAKVQVSELLRTFGWVHIMDLGDITSARGMEAYLLLWVSMYNKVNTAVLNVKVQK